MVWQKRIFCILLMMVNRWITQFPYSPVPKLLSSFPKFMLRVSDFIYPFSSKPLFGSSCVERYKYTKLVRSDTNTINLYVYASCNMYDLVIATTMHSIFSKENVMTNNSRNSTRCTMMPTSPLCMTEHRSVVATADAAIIHMCCVIFSPYFVGLISLVHYINRKTIQLTDDHICTIKASGRLVDLDF